jgi:hypothetical protein
MNSPTPVVIRLIGLKNHDDAYIFLAGLEKYIARLRRGRTPVTTHRPILRTTRNLVDELCAPADLAIVSAHGGHDTDAWLSDAVENLLCFGQFGDIAPGKIGTRHGILWDACQAGRPAFREAVEPHLAHEIVHIGVVGEIGFQDSVTITATFLRELLAPDIPTINADSITTAARKAQLATDRRLVHTLIGHGDPCC